MDGLVGHGGFQAASPGVLFGLEDAQGDEPAEQSGLAGCAEQQQTFSPGCLLRVG
ncbi:hypothetical protein OG905_38390 [Streptomyces sp. NBC_00322]|uniref:hypothetical protein n=1 Tax=Streptomyces sp. NBC_00322 TaxID=2975712 RepID=UPI002E2DF5B8|nr:hypothetical protein [Streptomyces sp. NBC_00322]